MTMKWDIILQHSISSKLYFAHDMTLNSFMHKIGGDLIFIDVKRLDHDFFYVLLDCNSRFCYSKNITFLPINMVERGTAMYLPYLGNSPYKSGMRIRILIRIRSDPLIFGPPDGTWIIEIINRLIRFFSITWF